MPTYEYECNACKMRFEREQAMSDEPLQACPECGAPVRRLVSGGTGFLFKGEGQGRASSRGGSCSLETMGKTCCGRSERCGTPRCEE
ncbi:MAG TPA: zinc ribbon domain-containing protein [Deltaproteobacteria bacterium]|nr:zinc ribbon domain-containing protein [Deltaproteobacteria bacterium]HPR56072.1 zinc ribbon domain-containing protein [Deltaproteobacteria bacterium]HXK47868.1 zinc ribbon domain-containing protein [Deltaproteobacteria bacterium]